MMFALSFFFSKKNLEEEEEVSQQGVPGSSSLAAMRVQVHRGQPHPASAERFQLLSVREKWLCVVTTAVVTTVTAT